MRDASAGTLRISIERLDRAIVVRAEGEVDLEHADTLSAALRAAGSDDRVVLDLLGVPFMDSSGLRALLIGSATLGHRLCLVISPGAPVGRLLDLADVRDRFRIHGSVEAALGDRPEDAP